ncbi:hypothetical protein [Alcaligenes faecalis]|uniref:hypothetical protein n=1 Tax=Alcaligenes aquatilis TaxID=323284 RepID=UPI002AA8C206|nr:hypothetical protein [Alcaligenes faecalis]
MSERTPEVFGDLSDATVISRYMSFAAFASLLQTKRLFFNTVSQFEDRNEGTSTMIDALAKSTGPSLDFIMNFLWPVVSLTPEDQENREAQKAEARRKCEQPQSFNTPFGPFVDGKKLGYKAVLLKLRNWLDASCWHIGDNESLAMWKLYGQTTEAVCIVSTVGKLRSSLRLKGEQKCVIAQIAYINHSKDSFTRRSEEFDAILHKMHAFAFEQEARAVVWNPSADFLQERSSLGFGSSVEVNLSLLIDMIRVSPDSKPWFKELVISFLQRENLVGAKVELSMLDHDHWKD